MWCENNLITYSCSIQPNSLGLVLAESERQNHDDVKQLLEAPLVAGVHFKVTAVVATTVGNHLGL